jgi:hypothetical protein
VSVHAATAIVPDRWFCVILYLLFFPSVRACRQGASSIGGGCAKEVFELFIVLHDSLFCVISVLQKNIRGRV